MMEIDEESEQPAQHHPLMNDLVLKHLVKKIRLRDIPSCRQVCEKWNQYFIPRMRAEIYVKCLHQTSFGKSTLLAKFIAVMESSREIPFGNYLLLNLNMNDPLVEKFFVVCGFYIHTLRVQFMPSDIDISSFRELLLLRAPSLVNLSLEGLGLPETITNRPTLFPNWPGLLEPPTLPYLSTIQFKTDEGQKCHEGFLADLFKATINLTNLTFTKYSDTLYSLKILGALYQSSNYLKMSCINLESLNELSLQILIKMSQEGMKLKQLWFQSLAEDVENSLLLEELILYHKETLQSLSLNEVMGPQHLRIRLPPLPRLRVLTRSAICSSQILFGPICYATQMPSLETFFVHAFADELNWDDYFSETVNWLPCISLKKLEFPINLKDPIKLKRLAKLFPSVTSITMNSPSDDIIPCLWELWPELEELHLSLTDRNSNVDTLFTGIPAQECLTINANKSYGEVDIERIRTAPSIAFLRGLKKLVLDISPKDIFSNCYLQNTTCMPTDVTGYFGLSCLANLEHLSISASQISKECVVFLTSKYQRFATVDVNDQDNLPIIVCTRVL